MIFGKNVPFHKYFKKKSKNFKKVMTSAEIGPKSAKIGQNQGNFQVKSKMP